MKFCPYTGAITASVWIFILYTVSLENANKVLSSYILSGTCRFTGKFPMILHILLELRNAARSGCQLMPSA